MEIDDKGGEIVQRYEAWGEIVQRGRDKIWKRLDMDMDMDMDMDKEGATLEKRMDHKSWTREAHK